MVVQEPLDEPIVVLNDDDRPIRPMGEGNNAFASANAAPGEKKQPKVLPETIDITAKSEDKSSKFAEKIADF